MSMRRARCSCCWSACMPVPAAARDRLRPAARRGAAPLRRAAAPRPRRRGAQLLPRRCCAPPMPLMRAEAAWALGDLRTANELFRAAVAEADAARRAAARALGPHVPGMPARRPMPRSCSRKRCRSTKAIVGARLAMARLTVERFDGDVTDRLAQLLAENADLVEAHLVAARMAIEGGELDDAVALGAARAAAGRAAAPAAARGADAAGRDRGDPQS